MKPILFSNILTTSFQNTQQTIVFLITQYTAILYLNQFSVRLLLSFEASVFVMFAHAVGHTYRMINIITEPIQSIRL